MAKKISSFKARSAAAKKGAASRAKHRMLEDLRKRREEAISLEVARQFRANIMAGSGLDFSAALALMKAGACVCRLGWNGKGMFVYYVPGSAFYASRTPLDRILGVGEPVEYLPHIDMRTAQGRFVPWLASQSDLLASDWMVLRDVPRGTSAHRTEARK